MNPRTAAKRSRFSFVSHIFFLIIIQTPETQTHRANIYTKKKMVKHVESADEFDALKKASKPVSSP